MQTAKHFIGLIAFFFNLWVKLSCEFLTFPLLCIKEVFTSPNIHTSTLPQLNRAPVSVGPTPGKKAEKCNNG